eukprot:4602596-Pleurochrysis_carterae.AAC.1
MCHVHPLSTTKPILRRPSRRCLLRRGALRRALDAIKAKLRVAIGRERHSARGREVSREGVDTAASTTVLQGGGANARRRHATSIEGEAIAKSITASL